MRAIGFAAWSGTGQDDAHRPALLPTEPSLLSVSTTGKHADRTASTSTSRARTSLLHCAAGAHERPRRLRQHPPALMRELHAVAAAVARRTSARLAGAGRIAFWPRGSRRLPAHLRFIVRRMGSRLIHRQDDCIVALDQRSPRSSRPLPACASID